MINYKRVKTIRRHNIAHTGC
ncbi:hypothetical protein CY0110_15862 [Crocosphaera chwakensis CCY0110]|uniref:Uncharacterized protein n=1 Tax=Crocosphaera chwakensis CCY0110 TaxID=391612 RepID=A3IHK4_9CHRO|nr:hypothetical protein CY0110_15862 [Crocosphaera chwakensis CCY0110]